MSHPDSQTPITLSMHRLELRFIPLGDRYAHLVGYHDDEQFIPLFKSVEGTAEQPWPESPPLQEVHVERREGGHPLALCVGASGRSHWSLSVELRSDERRMLFDVACRVKEDLPEEGAAQRFPLGSSYVAHVPVEEAAEGRVQFEAAGHLFEVESLAAEQSADGRLVPDFDAWRLEPAGWLEGPRPRTIRWRYALRQLG